ncbi:MAG TPA: MurR/RpiR family transcriptional regulator [Candidatus Faeciplasma pullistercoris]|uniref:MurR/RpiR family transcriptional regulator n=1 Tax=Candidatus Faeciplasma pullistercoris TaxID=2840800 RepID=A0A9D1GU08_9FIRM|nr:MurR/RpiR family transcriptional regulator [Candidatus Faeciplasma pullistercoris]
MVNDIFEFLDEKRDGMSKSHRKIADFILEHYDRASFLTAAKLGESVGVSESTVVRFAAELGFDGYPSLQRVLQEATRNKLTAVQRIEVSHDRLKGAEVFRKVLQNDIEHIRQTIEETAEDSFNAAVDSIISAKSIYIMGIRSSAALASFMSYYFKLMLPNVILVQTGSRSELYEQLMRIGEGDLIIGISFPRYSKQTVNALAYACSKGADSVAITDSMDSPVASHAGKVLLARSDMVSFVDSLVAPLSLINALIVAVSIKNYDAVSKSFKALEQIWEEYDVYEKNGEAYAGV